MDGIIEYFKPLFDLIWAIIEIHIFIYKGFFCGPNILGPIFGIFFLCLEIFIFALPYLIKNYGGGGWFGFIYPPNNGGDSGNC